MIRVLHCIGSLDIGGSQAFIMNAYRKIDRTKVQFDFIVFPENVEGHYDEVRRLGGSVFVCPRFTWKNSVKFLKWWHAFFREHKEYRIIHGHVRSVAALYLSIAKSYGLQTIVHSHSTSNGRGFSAIVKSILQKPLRNTADYLFSCSDLAGKWLFGEQTTKRDNYRMVPNGIDCQQFTFSKVHRDQTRANLGIEKDAFVIGHVGRFHEAKNHVFLLKVFQEVLQHCPQAVLLLVGDGDLREEMERRCREAGITKSVVFAGAQAAPERFYSAMDIFLFPSKWEGLPLSVVEAQTSGLPCVISDAITQDVKLTDLVMYLPLSAGVEYWANTVLSYAQTERKGLSEEMAMRLKPFDSEHVAAQMQEFYLSL